MMAFPRDTIRRMAWPHKLFSARKSTMTASSVQPDTASALGVMRRRSPDVFSWQEQVNISWATGGETEVEMAIFKHRSAGWIVNCLSSDY